MTAIGISEKKKQKACKKQVIEALEQMIQCVKASKVEDVELNVEQDCPPFGEFLNNCGVMQTVPGSIVYNNIQLTFKSKRKDKPADPLNQTQLEQLVNQARNGSL